MIDDVMKVRLIAASLVAALLAGPVVLDVCLFTCHASASTQADADSDAPSCHHAADERDARLEPPPASCGHDHSPAPSIATSVKAPDAPDAQWSSTSSDPARDVCDLVRLSTLEATCASAPLAIHARQPVPLRV
jgi:hypothetical protein